MKRAYLSLGSNLGDRRRNIERALELMGQESIEVRRVSSLYQTEPVDYRRQPWFLNCAVIVETDRLPLHLMKALLRIERQMGRRRGIPKGPRLIDIDILFYENAVVHSAELQIPHPRLADRKFVLAPLAEIAPELRHPVSERTVLEMLNETRDTSQVIRFRENDSQHPHFQKQNG